MKHNHAARKISLKHQLSDAVSLGLTSHDTVAICGLHPWRSTVDVWGEKKGVLKQTLNLLEPAKIDKELKNYIATLFTLKSGKRVRRSNALLQHPHYPWMVAAIDRSVIGENSFLECKSLTSNQARDWRKELPLWIILQMQHKLVVTGASHCYIAALTGNTELIVHSLSRSERLITALIDKGSHFWQLVQQQQLPVPNGSQATEQAINRLFPLANNYEKIDLPEYAGLLTGYDKLVKQHKKLSKKIAVITQKLKMRMGQASSAYIGNRRVDWRNVHKQTLQTQRLKQEMPDIYEKYLLSKTERIFKIN